MAIADVPDDGELELEQAATAEVTAVVNTVVNTAIAAHDLRGVVGGIGSM